MLSRIRMFRIRGPDQLARAPFLVKFCQALYTARQKRVASKARLIAQYMLGRFSLAVHHENRVNIRTTFEEGLPAKHMLENQVTQAPAC